MKRPIALLLLASAACSSSSADAPPSGSDAGPPADAAAMSADDTPPPILPYPPGPYGTGAVGQRLADFRVQGYAMSETQRDSTKLPFRDITLAEVRSKPGCECLIVVWTGAGQACGPCVEADGAVSAGLLRHPSLCALEVVEESFDSFATGRNGNEPSPPTRSDLDLFTQTGREPYPVGLFTDEALAKLGSGAIPAIPTSYVVRTSDMRIAGTILGRAEALATDALALCAAPLEGVVTLASGIAPRALALDATDAYVADDFAGIVRVPRAGGEAQLVSPTAFAATAVALGPSEVYWAASSTLGAAPKNGGDGRVLASAVATYTSIATDGSYLYYTLNDGRVGRVDVLTKEDVTLAEAESDPAEIAVDETTVYWLDRASSTVVSMAKMGGTRTSLYSAPGDRIDGLIVTAGATYARENGNTEHFDRILRRGKEDDTFFLQSQIGRTASFSYDAAADVLDFVQAPYARSPDHNAIGVVTAKPLGTEATYAQMLTFGVRNVTGIASGGDGYVYWTTNAPGAGALQRMKR